MIKIIKLLLLSCLVGLPAYADPAITTVTTSTTFVHGATLTISGSGFGEKSTAAPAIWDDCETGSATDQWTVYPYEAPNSAYNMQYRSTYREVAQAHANSTKYAVGGHDPDATGYSSGNNVALCQSVPTSSNFYASCYMREDPNWPNVISNHKCFNSSDTCISYSSSTSNVFYVEYYDSQYENNQTYHINSYSTPTYTTNSDPAVYTAAATDLRQGWSKIELIVDRDSFIYIYENGVRKYEGHADSTSDGANHFTFGYYWDGDSANAWRYFDDMYYDTTFQRVVLANNSTYASATKIEIQPPSAWSDTSITVTMNQGQAASEETWYLFVIDSTNDVSDYDTETAGDQGYPLTIGGSGSSPAVSNSGVCGNGVSNSGGG